MNTRPGADEHAEYYGGYVEQVPDVDIVEYLTAQIDSFTDLMGTVDQDRGRFRYDVGKWSINELIGHLIDTERVFAVRALAFARKDKTPWPGMEQDDYVAEGDFDSRTLADLCDEFVQHRKSLVAFFSPLDEETMQRRGVASDCEFTVRAIAYIVAGHFNHHLDVLKERYL